MTKATFNIFDELANWGKTLPLWQRCLLAKLVASLGGLSESDVDQVFTEFLIDQKLVEHSGPRADYVVAVPKLKSSAQQVLPHLKIMSDVSGVNALAAGEQLTFGSKITIIYGPNASGKSGYARTLKATCFTRSHQTQILGDVRLEEAKRGTPTAKFEFDDGTAATYVYENPCPRLRDNFAVFDSSCIRVHLDERNAFQVMPYLFDVFPRMVQAFSGFRKSSGMRS